MKLIFRKLLWDTLISKRIQSAYHNIKTSMKHLSWFFPSLFEHGKEHKQKQHVFFDKCRGSRFWWRARYFDHVSSAMHLSSSRGKVSSSGPPLSVSAMPVVSAMPSAMPSGMQMSSAVLGSPGFSVCCNGVEMVARCCLLRFLNHGKLTSGFFERWEARLCWSVVSRWTSVKVRECA